MEDTRLEVFTVVPSYNHGRYIERCLRSIFAQTRTPKKLLVIDDGSTDDSPKIIEKTLRDCPFDSELIVRENRGLCATLNQAYELSDGEFFAYLGADDVWLPQFLQERTKLMRRHPNAVLGYGHAYFIDENDRVINSSIDYAPALSLYESGNVRELLLSAMAPISSTVFYRRSALAGVEWNERSRLEDYEMYIRLSNLGEFAFDPQILAAWRYHGHNTSKDLEMMVAEVIGIQERRTRELQIAPDDLRRLQDETRFRFARMMLQHGDKRGAFALGRRGWRGASSVSQLLTFAVRLIVPMAVVRLKRDLTRSEAAPALPLK